MPFDVAAYKAQIRDVNHALFQASMWRRYAMNWTNPTTGFGYPLAWMERVFRTSRAECLAHAWAALERAKEMR